jgi:hypothetical protein
VRILLAATGVVNLRCSLQDDYQIHSAIPPLFHLKSLILYDSEYAAPNGRAQELLLDALTAPALRHLLVSEPQLGDQPISTITSFLSRSHCSLDSLQVTDSQRCEKDYRSVFPSIKVIEVSALNTDNSSVENEEDGGSDESDDDAD